MASANDTLPPIRHVLETCLYVRHKEESVQFYREVFGLEPFIDLPRLCGFSLGNTILLLFQLGATADDIVLGERGVVPGHGPSKEILDLMLGRSSEGDPALTKCMLKQHFCLAVHNPAEVSAYEKRFQMKNVRIAGTVDWELGGRSVYFIDPDGHVGEIGSRGIWPSY